MMTQPASDRFQLARRLLAIKQDVSRDVVDQFFTAHPEWDARFGDHGRLQTANDTCFHIDFLAGAIEAGSPDAFGDYSRWSARVLGSRGMDARLLEEHLSRIQERLFVQLMPPDRETVAAYMDTGRNACIQPAPNPDSTGPSNLTARAFLAAILAGRRLAALQIVEQTLNDGQPLTDVYVDVLAASLHAVGRLWEMNRITVAQEHMATAIAQYVLAAIYPRMDPPQHPCGSMVVTGVAGEQHQIGANLVADAMEAQGWAVRFLGTNLPHPSVINAIQEVKAEVLCISTTLVSNLPSVAELIKLVRARLGVQAPRIVLGGAAYRHAPDFLQQVGPVEFFSDLRRALAMLNSPQN